MADEQNPFLAALAKALAMVENEAADHVPPDRPYRRVGVPVGEVDLLGAARLGLEAARRLGESGGLMADQAGDRIQRAIERAGAGPPGDPFREHYKREAAVPSDRQAAGANREGLYLELPGGGGYRA